MKVITQISFALLFIVGIQDCYAFEYADAKITISVVSESGVPVANALVTGGFFSKDIAGGGTDFKGYSDIKGQFSVSGRTHGEISYLVRKDGYYYTSGKYREWFVGNGKVEDGRWEPWNPTIEIVLKKIKDPIPMYAKRVREAIPTFDKPCGYDLQKGDWVVPYGIGVNSDLIFDFGGRFKSLRDRDESLVISFSNEHDGVQEYISDTKQKSKLRTPHNAPVHGYKKKWHRDKSMTDEGAWKNQQLRKRYNLIFRVRTKLDKNGNIKEAKYGKIYGDIEFGYSKQDEAMVIFKYYFNPDGTRNLEFNPKQNLFRNLSSFEEVQEP